MIGLLLACRGERAEPADVAQDRGPAQVILWRDDLDLLDRGAWNVTTSASGDACRSDGQPFNAEVQAYTDETDCASPHHTLCVSGGTAKIVVRRRDAIGCAGFPARYTSARLNTKGKRGFFPTDEHPALRIEARIRMPAPTPGVWPAFWTLGRDLKQGPRLGGDDNDWPDAGEIDIAEVGWAWEQAGVTLASLHDSPGTWSAWDGEGHRRTGAGSHPISPHAWHVYSLDWTRDTMRWSIDGAPFATVDLRTLPNHDFEHEHFLLLNFAMGGWGGGEVMAADDRFPSDGTRTTPAQVMEVDWVQVLSLDGAR